MADKIFTQGLFVNEPRQDFIKYSISIRVDEFKAFLEEYKNDKGYVNIDFKTSQKSGKAYGELNTWKPDKDAEALGGKVVEAPKELTAEEIPF